MEYLTNRISNNSLEYSDVKQDQTSRLKLGHRSRPRAKFCPRVRHKIWVSRPDFNISAKVSYRREVLHALPSNLTKKTLLAHILAQSVDKPVTVHFLLAHPVCTSITVVNYR